MGNWNGGTRGGKSERETEVDGVRVMKREKG